MKNAFNGVKNLIGEARLEKLANSKFLVIGIGGVGSWIAEFLARSGCLNITLVDLDEICVTNINRQIHADHKSIGKSKIQVMKERILNISPDCNVVLIEDFLTQSTINDIITEEYDFVFDAIDSVKNKCLIIQKCKKLRLPFIIVGAAGQRIDPTLVKISDLNKTINDRLLFQVKKKLKREYGYSKNSKRSYRAPVVFSTEIPLGVTSTEECEFKSGTVSNCESGLGSVGFVTAAFANAAVSFAIKKVLDFEAS